MIEIQYPEKTNSQFSIISFHYFPLLLFCFFEVILYGEFYIYQVFFSTFQYLLLAVIAILNVRVAILYFISFSFLSYGAWSYVVTDYLPGNFWGLRYFGISINFLFSLYILFVFFLRFKLKAFTEFPRIVYFFYFFYGISLFIGIIYCLFNINYFDNYLKDLIIYLPLLIYPLLIFNLEKKSALKIFTYCVSLTLLGMFFSLIFGIFFEYGSGLKFILVNSFGYIIMFILPFCRKYFSNYHYYFLLFIAIVLLISGKFFVGGKFIILILFSFIWYFLVFRRNFFLVGFSFTLIALSMLFWVQLIDSLLFFYSDNLLVQIKLNQVISIFEIFDLDLLSATPTSVGNIVAELRTIYQYFQSNPNLLITGLGFGGGVPDIFGFLTPMANPGMGYSEIDAVRNNFFRMHLPVFEFFLKSGILGGFLFLQFSFFKFLEKNIFSFFYFLVFFTVFTNNKEMIMLSLFFLHLSSIDDSTIKST